MFCPDELSSAALSPEELSPEELSPEELARYGRHLALADFGPAGQARLKGARVLLIGAGGLGSPLGLYLAAAGVGVLGIVDGDRVEDSNLQRQVLFTTGDIGALKAERAAARLAALNPHIDIRPYPLWLSADNALQLIQGYDLVIDGSDNFATRYLVNDACVLAGKPLVYGSISGFEGQASVFHHRGGPCYRCLFPEPPPPGTVLNCAEGGVLGVLPAIIASIQATEAIKLLTGIGESLSGRLLHYDARGMRFREFRAARDEECPVCGERPTIVALEDYRVVCEAPREGAFAEISPGELKALLADEDTVLIDVRDPWERDICHIPGSRAAPLDILAEVAAQLDRSRRVICYCKTGSRSASACRQLAEAGFSNLDNLRGGILAWIEELEPGLPRY
ncbi:MAG: molybdopterin-synthase adenylyltransferase MoeB [Pseudomonadota bacterium]|nr:molybdopterin-synthase adenylyltransferase MoeB [Pseudomonadota bacterium]